LAIKAANSSSMARCQFESMRVVRTEEGTGDKVDAEVVDRVSLPGRKPEASLQPRGHRMRIVQRCHRMAFTGSVC
jgi:hypothetical protein